MLPFIVLACSLISAIEAPAPVFKEQVIDDKIDIGYGVALGDVDGDRKTDILLADSRQIVWYRNGDWQKFVIAENLTERDNVCIAARDIDGDGKVEIAVGAQWNPSETSDSTKSGSVHYLVRPSDPTQRWESVTLRHEPTVHRMRWVKSDDRYYLVVLPLHGRNNKGGEGSGVRVYAYEFPKDVRSEWNRVLLSEEMHMTHNMDVNEKNGTRIYIAGKEGVQSLTSGFPNGGQAKRDARMIHGAGEVRLGKNVIATIEPMHGNKVVVYPIKDDDRVVLDSSYNEGHALAVADFVGTGYDQVVAGWRNPDKQQQQVGVKMFVQDKKGNWKTHWIDKNGMACEDLQIADLDGDGKQDIVASGRATKNLKIYWNRSN